MVVKVTCDSVPLTLKNLPCGSHRGAPGYGLPQQHNLRSMGSVLWALGQVLIGGGPQEYRGLLPPWPHPCSRAQKQHLGSLAPEPS